MKTLNAKVLCALLLFCCSFFTMDAQHTHIINNSTASNPQIELEDETANNFTRLRMSNSNVSDYWMLAGRLTSSSNDILGAYYNGSTRFSYTEELSRFWMADNAFVAPVKGTIPTLTLDIDKHDAAYLYFDSNAGNMGTIKAFTNQNGSAIPPYLSLEAPGNSNFMTMWDGYTIFADSQLGAATGSGKVIVSSNSTASNPQLKVSETNTSDFARIGFTNAGAATNSFNIAARPGHATDKRFQVAYNTEELLVVIGDDQLVGVNDISPSANFHVKQVGSGQEGIAIENDTDTDIWSWEIGGNDLNVYFNGTNKGFWNDVDGVYTASDRRLKNAIAPMEKGVLSKLLSLNATTYSYNDVERDHKTFGFIAQDVQEVFPEIVSEFDDGSGLLAIAYSKVGVLAVEAIKEQQEIIDAQANEIKELKSQMESILERLDTLEEK